MARWAKFAAVNALIFGALPAAVVFVCGAWAAEIALRPPRLPVARVCPCFAHERCESVAIAAADGVGLRAWYYTPEAPDGREVILLHGVGSNRQDMLALGHLFLKQGYSVLEPDLRGHGESGGLATYGVLEEGDIRRWVDWMEEAGKGGPQRIYGFGASLGGAVLLQSLKHETRFRAIVAESAYSDFPSVARERIERILPGGFQWIATPLVDSGMIWARWHDGIDLRQASPIGALRSARVPVLLIHGLADDKTSPDNSRRLAAANPAVQLWLVPGSGHADAWKTAPAEFEARVNGWFSTH